MVSVKPIEEWISTLLKEIWVQLNIKFSSLLLLGVWGLGYTYRVPRNPVLSTNAGENLVLSCGNVISSDRWII